jgi:hypothetical protein
VTDSRSGEPVDLRRGKEFHRLVQASWRDRHGGFAIAIEGTLTYSQGQRGRSDIQVYLADAVPFESLLEIKSRDFDRMTARGVRRAIQRDRRQIWRYLDNLLGALDKPGADVAPVLIYSGAPRDPQTKVVIETFFDEWSITVHWWDQDEVIGKESSSAESTP